MSPRAPFRVRSWGRVWRLFALRLPQKVRTPAIVGGKFGYRVDWIEYVPVQTVPSIFGRARGRAR